MVFNTKSSWRRWVASFLHPLAFRPYAALNSPRRFGTSKVCGMLFLKKMAKGCRIAREISDKGDIGHCQKSSSRSVSLTDCIV